MIDKIWSLLVLRTGSSEEWQKRLANYLASVDILLYLPLEKKLVTRGRGSKRRQVVDERPLFSGYGLAQMAKTETPFRAVLSPPAKSVGIMDVVRKPDGYPAVVSDKVVEYLFEREKKGEFTRFDLERGKPVIRPEWLKVGNEVIVNKESKLLFGTKVKIDSINYKQKKAKVFIAVGEHSNAIPLEISIDHLEPFSAD